MDKHDEEWMHKKLRSEGNNYEWKHRMYVTQLKENSLSKPADGELLINPNTGHISVKNNEGLVSATKNIESELDSQKLILEGIKASLEKADTKVKNLIKVQKDQNDRISELYALVHKMEELMNEIDAIIPAVNTTVNNNSLNLFRYYKLVREFLPVFLFEYLNVVEVMRKIDELAYIYDQVQADMTATSNKLAELKTTYSQDYDYAKTFAFKRAYLDFLNNVNHTWNNVIPKIQYPKKGGGNDGNHTAASWGKFGKLHITALEQPNGTYKIQQPIDTIPSSLYSPITYDQWKANTSIHDWSQAFVDGRGDGIHVGIRIPSDDAYYKSKGYGLDFKTWLPAFLPKNQYKGY